MMNASPSPAKPTLFRTGGTLFCGFVVCVFSLNGVLRNLGGIRPGTKLSNILLGLAAIPDGIYDAAPGGKYFLLELLVRWTLLSLAVFVCLLLLNSIRHRTANIFISGSGGLLLGLFALTWLSLLIFVIGVILFVFFWLTSLLKLIITGIISFLLWPPILFTLIGLVVVAGAIFLVAQLRNVSLEEILDWIKGLLGRLSAKPLIVLAGVAAVAALVWFVGIPLWREYIGPLIALIAAWLREYVAPVLGWIFAAVAVLILALLALVAIGAVLITLGRQFIDQFASAYTCGRDIHGAFATGFGVGAVAGLALLVCSTNDEYRAVVNAAWSNTSPLFADVDIINAVYALMPGSAERFLQGLFVKASLPIFDVTLLVVTLFLANCSLLMGLLSGVTVEPLRRLLARDRLPVLFNLVFALLVGVALIAINSAAGEDS